MCFFFNIFFLVSSSTAPLLCARSMQPLTAVAMAAQACSTEITRNYRNKLQRYVEYSEVTDSAADQLTFLKSVFRYFL